MHRDFLPVLFGERYLTMLPWVNVALPTLPNPAAANMTST
jgi:hypothetical protein